MAIKKDDYEIKVIKAKVPKRCICPDCGKEQPFKKYHEHWKKVKDLNLSKPKILTIQRISAKCLNPSCQRRSFVLPIPEMKRYQRTTERVKREALDKNILDNIPYHRAAKSLSRLNTSGSKSSIDRWKQREAERYSFKEIIGKLNFSGILSIDEYKPKKAKHYDLIAGDAVKWHILYLETIAFSSPRAGTIGRGSIEDFCWHLRDLGIKPWTIIFDLLAVYPKQVRKVWPGITMQFDYFHVMQKIHKHLKEMLMAFRRSLKGKEWQFHREELWENRWRLLKNMDRWSIKDHEIISELIQIYADTPVERALIFKQQLFEIFDMSCSKEEAYKRRDKLFQESWWRDSPHLQKIMKFLMSRKFKYMITYLGNKRIPRSGNIENMIKHWRDMERPRFGFKTERGKQNHLKLYQLKQYLKEE